MSLVPGRHHSVLVGGIIQESLGGIIPLQTGGFAGIGIASIAFIILVAGLSTAPVQAKEYNGASIENAAFAVYTPSMAARGERFYVGRD